MNDCEKDKEKTIDIYKSMSNGVDIHHLVHWNKYIPVKPFANQLAFLRLRVLEALYGGATRGGMNRVTQTLSRKIYSSSNGSSTICRSSQL
ncbi:MAG: hypothetical protein WC175_02975 [Candidatus Dojkabacteria bacterium]